MHNPRPTPAPEEYVLIPTNMNRGQNPTAPVRTSMASTASAAPAMPV